MERNRLNHVEDDYAEHDSADDAKKRSEKRGDTYSEEYDKNGKRISHSVVTKDNTVHDWQYSDGADGNNNKSSQYIRDNPDGNVESSTVDHQIMRSKSKAKGGHVTDEEWEPKKQTAEGHVDKTGNGINEIDADNIIDLFLEENPDLAEMPVEEWPEDAIKELQSVINAKGVDSPTGLNAEQEKEPDVEETIIEEVPTIDKPNDEQDFDIMELAKLVEAGDKDGAWDMLNSMFGARTEHSEVKDEPTNTLDRMVSDSRVKRLSAIISSLKF